MTMGDAGPNFLEVELALDRVEAQLAAELPAHMRAFAQAHAAGAPAPAAPDLAGRASTASIAKRALAHPELATRGVALMRLVAPILIERDAGVAAALAANPTWQAYAALTAARTTVARARFGRSALDVLHRLNGVGEAVEASTLPEPIEAWNAVEAPLSSKSIDEVWELLEERFGVVPRPAIVRSGAARPRTFVEQAGSSATVVIPAVVDTPAKRFAVLHELGHAVLNLSSARVWPRALDEASASFVARLMESAGELPPGWHSPHAADARRRRVQLARHLATIERAVDAGEPVGDKPGALVPWALWHDPGAQSAYVRAESIADDLVARFGDGKIRLASELDAEAIRCDFNAVI
jgi:hypothetical protein